MEIKIIKSDKKEFLDLLLLADEQENMIEKYLDRGTLFALYDDGLKSVCVVTDEGLGCREIQNLATYEPFQKKGYGGYLVNYVCEYYKRNYAVMFVGTGDSPLTVPFYEHCGFTFSHRVENYFPEHYDKPIFEAGVRLKDKVYLKKFLNDYLSASNIIDFDTSRDVINTSQKIHSRAENEIDFIKNAYEFVRDEIPHSADIRGKVVTCAASEVLRAVFGAAWVERGLH